MIPTSSALCNSNPNQSENKIYAQLFTQQFSSKSDLTLCNENKIGHQHSIQKSEDDILRAGDDRLYYNAKFLTQYPPKITKDNIEAFLNSEYFNVDEFVRQHNMKNNEASLSIDDQINHIVHDIHQSMNNKKYESNIIRIDAYRKKYSSNWSKPYECKMITDFKRRVGKWDYNKYDMHHVTLNVNHKGYNPFEAEAKISRNRSDLIHNISRGKKSVEIIDWYAIKEWDESAPYPHLHLYLLIKKEKTSLRTLVKKYWKMGPAAVKHKVKSHDYFENLLNYPDKRHTRKYCQMKLPDIFKDTKNIRRVYRMQTKKAVPNVKKLSNVIPFAEFKKRWFEKSSDERLALVRKQLKTGPILIKDNQKSKTKKRSVNKKYNPNRKSMTYGEREIADQSTIVIRDPNSRRGFGYLMETPMSILNQIPGNYDDDKAFVMEMPISCFWNLMEIERLFRIKKGINKRAA